MTKIELMGFECSRCGKTFLSYVEGYYLRCDNHEGMCFNAEDVGIIHENSYLNTIKGKRECRKCRKCLDLMSFK